METFLERQGFYDYINHVIAGVVLAIGLEIILIPFDYSLISTIYQKLYQQYLLINSNGTLTSENVDMLLWNISIILLCFLLFYLIGVSIQELYCDFYSSGNHKHKIRFPKNMMIKKASCHNMISKMFRILLRLVIKVQQEKYIDNLFEDSNLIINSIKRKQYKQYAEDVMKEKELFSEKEIVYDKELSSYFFAYCVYYIQVRGKDKKLEKLRDIAGLSMSLSLIFLFLALGSVIALAICYLYSIDYILFEIIYFIINVSLSILFDCYTERAVKNRIRMTLAVYEAEKGLQTYRRLDKSIE